MTQQFDYSGFEKTAREALVVSSTYIKDAIGGRVDLSDYLTKGDKTAVTIVDKESQARALPIIERDLGSYRLNAEEADDDSGDLDSSTVIYFDPLDGTAGFLIGGPTPTVILGAYDSTKKQILAAATMEPTTGRFWYSAKDKGAKLSVWDYSKERWDSEEGQPLKVNSQDIADNGIVLVDISHPFSRLGGTREILTQKGRRQLANLIEDTGNVEMSSCTNGGHYALVASGGPKLAGNITTAIGGPFDIIGLIHVIEAGGVGDCLRIKGENSNRTIRSIGQDIENADLVIATNNLKNYKTLRELVDTSIKF
jgi:fructose-1,6-bisphosphatase/inositol monophosphatase family enzyme